MPPQREWIARMLSALEYPFELEVSDPSSLARLVSWVEDRKVRQWEIADRGVLRVADSSWDGAFGRYLRDLECPVAWPKDPLDCLGFLLRQAVECEFEDDEERAASDAERACNERDDEALCAEEARALCDAVGLDRSRYKDADEVLLALQAAAAKVRDDDSPEEQPLADDRYPLGFTTGDRRSDDIARSLRLIYLLDLRRLQDAINDILIKAQNFVANPKTNSNLGKVGR